MIHHRQLHVDCACPVQAFHLLPRLMCVSTSRLLNPALLLWLRRCLKLTGSLTSGWEPITDSAAPAEAVARWSRLNMGASWGPASYAAVPARQEKPARKEGWEQETFQVSDPHLSHGIWAQLDEQRWHLQGQMIRLLPVVLSTRHLNTRGAAPEPLQFAML